MEKLVGPRLVPTPMGSDKIITGLLMGSGTRRRHHAARQADASLGCMLTPDDSKLTAAKTTRAPSGGGSLQDLEQAPEVSRRNYAALEDRIHHRPT